jgi:hypothetical protein
MISSQNWSADGTLRNRDARLIIRDARAAACFEQIFLHDWDHLATLRPGAAETGAGAPACGGWPARPMPL